MILSPTYKYQGLQHLLEDYNFASFDLLTNSPNHLGGNELDVDKHTKFGSNSYMECVFETPFRLLYSSAHPLTEHKIEKQINLFKEKDLLENAFEKFKKPCILQINNANGEIDFPQIFLNGNTPVDQMVLKEYTFFVFQIPHHKQRPKLATKIHNSFPSQELKENAAKLMALYNYRHTLGALINSLEDSHPLHEKAKSFNSYFMKKESGFENKFEKGFIKLFLTHTRLPNDPDDCYVMDNPQISLYEKCGGELFSDTVMKAIEEERKRQLDQIAFISECVEWAYYYKEISAQLYVVSAGDDYNKIALQAIIGIMIACKWKSISCQFAFTNSGWLNYLGGLMPRILREYVATNTQIWFLNDVCGAKGRLKDKPFFTVDLCSRSDAEDEDDSDKDQHPKIKVAISSRTVEVRGMSVFKLEDIRNEEDHRNIGSRVSASLKVTLSRHPLKHNNRITDKCYLAHYLEYIGHPNPSKPTNIENVMKCVIGDLLVLQMMGLHKGPSEYLEIIPELLKCKTKGTSEFVLNFTKTASVSANVIVYISNNISLEISNKKLLNARFKVINAKTTSLKITMHLTFAEKYVSIDLVEHLNLDGSIGITLAEYIANYNYTGIVWKPAKCLSLVEALHVLFKEDYVVSILKSIPLGFSVKVSPCKIQHYLSYIKLDDENRIEEAHIHMESPGPVANEDVCLEIKLISLHLYPARAVIENSVQLKGMGLINGFKVEFNTCLSSYLSQDVDVKFCDSLATERAFDILNLKINESVIKQHLKDKIINNFTTHLIFSQTVPHSMATEVTFLAFGVDPDSVKCHPLPPQFSDVTNADSYLGLHFPFRNKISNSVVNEISNPVISEISNP